MKQYNNIYRKILSVILILTGLVFLDVILSLSSILQFSVNNKSISGYTITAHRGGYENLLPENSLAAIKSTLEKSIADRIEIDIHQTKDNQLVVIHDKSIDRTTTGKGLIKELTYQELLKIPLKGSKNNETIPLLEEVIKTINGSTKLVIELKYGNSFYPDIEKRTIEMIKKYHAEDWCIIHSFDDSILNKVHQLDASVSLHKLFVLKLRFLPVIFDNKLRFKTLEDYSFVDEFSVLYLFANKEIVQKSKKLNKKLNVWTVDKENTKQKLVRIGVNGIITNFP